MRDPGSHVLWLEECGAEAAPLVGGKAVGLGHLVRQGHRVPAGFAVSTAAYREALAAGGRPVTVGDRLAAEIDAAYRRLGGDDEVPVAVRSSATAEDTAEASFAGQQDTYLWVRGADPGRRARQPLLGQPVHRPGGRLPGPAGGR